MYNKRGGCRQRKSEGRRTTQTMPAAIPTMLTAIKTAWERHGNDGGIYDGAGGGDGSSDAEAHDSAAGRDNY